MFVSGKLLQVSPMSASNIGAHPSEPTLTSSTLGQAPRHTYKYYIRLEGKNKHFSLFSRSVFEEETSFKTHMPGVNVRQLFPLSLKLRANEQDVLVLGKPFQPTQVSKQQQGVLILSDKH